MLNVPHFGRSLANTTCVHKLLVLKENMKEKYGLVKVNRGYDINSISDQEVYFATHIMARKVMRKCCANEILVSVVSLDAQCTNGVQYKWDGYLCKEFLDDYCKV